ncbi:hypothetical protein [Chitinophaga sp.]|uniref:hypothetical protein n=1 Tax=Chitinophaga sp. TaxID=1869181 RepID=UPI0031CF9266
MNSTTPYEKLIAAKLNEVPVPDMSDAIWSDIEAQLDGVVQPPQKTRMPKFKGKGVVISAGACVVASVMIFYLTSNKKTLPPAENTVIVADTLTAADSIKEEITTPIPPVKIKKDPILLKDVPAVDTIATPDLLPEKQDTQQLVIPTPVPAYDSIIQYTPPPKGKKPKGVKGISNEDYKITTKGDSIK